MHKLSTLFNFEIKEYTIGHLLLYLYNKQMLSNRGPKHSKGKGTL